MDVVLELDVAAADPISARPPEAWSIVLTIFAVITGWRRLLLITSIPRRRRFVYPAIAAITVRPSSRAGVAPLPPWICIRWSDG